MHVMNDFSREIEINAPVELCYQLCRDFANYSNFSPNMQSVEHRQDNIWHWELTGPHGDVMAWDYLLVQEVPNQRLFWKSINGPGFDAWSDQNFVRIGPDRTKFIVQFTFQPHHMQLAGLYETLYAWHPDSVTNDLKAFKAYAEGIYQQTLAQEQAQDLSQQEKKQIRHPVPSR
jgi:uncharacterized membrane protein